MQHNQIIKNIEIIDEIMSCRYPRANIWQDECIYNMALVIREILIDMLERETREDDDDPSNEHIRKR